MSWRLRSESLSLSASRCSASSRRSSRSSAACKLRRSPCSGQQAAGNRPPRLRAHMRAAVVAWVRQQVTSRRALSTETACAAARCTFFASSTTERNAFKSSWATGGILNAATAPPPASGLHDGRARAWTGSSRWRWWWRVRTHSLRYCEHRSPASGVRSYVPLLRPPVPPGAVGTPDCAAALPGHISTLTKPD